MGKLGKSALSSCLLLILLILIIVFEAKVTAGRSLRLETTSYDDGLVSYGDRENESSVPVFDKGIMNNGEEEEEDEDEYCEQMYGFLPCSNTMLGHFFLIVVYEYLLFHGESYVATGGERIFNILGPGFFGASVFQILGCLPEAFILLASGLLESKEKAQELMLTGVGLLAGSTILLLTFLWGTCVIIASRDIKPPKNLENNLSSPLLSSNPRQASNPRQSGYQKFLSPGFGIRTDKKTSHTARIMMLSVIPFIVILLPKIFHLSSSVAETSFNISALVVSIVFLFSYFLYQTFKPWIQRRRLEYVKHEHLVVDIVNSLRERMVGGLLAENGAPNVTAIKSLFAELDQDKDHYISFSEVKKLLSEVKLRKPQWNNDRTVKELMKEIDSDGDKKIAENEFVTIFTKWLDEIKHAMERQYHSVKSFKDLEQILNQKIRKEQDAQKHLMAEIIRQVQKSSAIRSLLTDDGTPDVPAIKKLFESIDSDGDHFISQSEIKERIAKIEFDQVSWNIDEVATNIMEELDVNKDKMIDEHEFVTGIGNSLIAPNAMDSEDDTNQKTWEKTDEVLEEKNSMDRSVWAWTKAIMVLVLGIIILALLAEPLIHSVQNFSTAAGIPSFFVSFILVPLATNARVAISAIETACRRKSRTTSLTFSEIYGGVFMNNILGFAVLLALIYSRGLSWHFSAEVLVILIVCSIMGLAASFRSTFPFWTSILAYLLYPLSLFLVYVLNRSLWLS